MAKLKTFEEYVESLDRAEEIEKDTVAMGEPEEQGEGEEVVTADQPEADVPEGDEDNGAGEEVEDMDADTEEVYSEDDKETEEGDQTSSRKTRGIIIRIRKRRRRRGRRNVVTAGFCGSVVPAEPCESSNLSK